MNWTLRLGTLALILISVTSCNEAKLAVNTDVSTDIESPLRNTCQSGDLDPILAKCQDEDSPTFTSAPPLHAQSFDGIGGMTFTGFWKSTNNPSRNQHSNCYIPITFTTTVSLHGQATIHEESIPDF
jgi:hypothetical protein